MVNCDKPTCNGCYWHDADIGTCAKTESSPEIEKEGNENKMIKVTIIDECEMRIEINEKFCITRDSYKEI